MEPCAADPRLLAERNEQQQATQTMDAHFPLDGQVALVTGGRASAAPSLRASPAASWINGQILTVSGGGVQELD